ncbi:MAG TPA: ATP-binding protein, partial [Kofleriaceae bacterium]|nr:ATP-binding protein [Kofleriaceae bacterium]
SLADAQGRPFAEVFQLIDERSSAREPDPVARVLAERAPVGLGSHAVLVARDGARRAIDDSAAPILDGRGELHGVVVVFRDVTRRRELERFRDEYVGYISHDLRNPLSVIALQARFLARSLGADAPADSRRAVGVIADSAAFIDTLVKELLEMAHAESDQIALQRAPLALAGFLDAVVERAVATAERGRVRLEIVERATVSADANRLERVVVNFVQNAVKYAPPGSPIVVRLEATDDRAVVSVIDRGPGLSPEERGFVFDKYRRASSAGHTEGLGLGLYISRKIVEAHGGEIGVDSTPGAGAKFFVRLPRIAAALQPAADEPSAVPAGDLRGLRVLLVDDEVNAVSALSALLRDEGIEVASATSGERALVLAESAPPEVAIVDVQMPGMSGVALLERLRELQPGLPAILMSGHMADHAGIARAREQGGVAYVGKPVDLDELLSTLAALVRAPGAAVVNPA